MGDRRVPSPFLDPCYQFGQSALYGDSDDLAGFALPDDQFIAGYIRHLHF